MDDHVRINAGVIITTRDGGWTLRGLGEMLDDVDKFGRIKIGNKVYIGSNSLICPNTTLEIIVL